MSRKLTGYVELLSQKLNIKSADVVAKANELFRLSLVKDPSFKHVTLLLILGIL